MRRFFAENIDTSGEKAVLCGDEARHIARVLRMKPRDRVLLINGKGEECEAEIEECSDTSVTLDIISRKAGSAEPSVGVTLFQCLPKQGKMEVIIQKCVELGVHEIIPVASRRCVVRLDGRDGKLVRWNRVAQEAAKQCGRAYIPLVTEPAKLVDCDFSGFDLVLFAYENESEHGLKDELRGLGKAPERIAVIIGPEGGFEPGEAEHILAKGGVSVSLGRRILRTETAGMAMLAQIMYEFD